MSVRRTAVVRPREPGGAAVASAVTFLAGLWLVIAPLILGYRDAAATPEAVVNDVNVVVVIEMASLSAAITYRRREERSAPG